jgi:hypothetical protein
MSRPVKCPSFAVSSKKWAIIEVPFCASEASLWVVARALANLEPDEELPRLFEDVRSGIMDTATVEILTKLTP